MEKKIIDRINKLMALSTSSNVNESAKAAEMAFKLMEEYNISSKDLTAANLTDTLGEIGRTELAPKGNMATWEKQLSVVLGKYFDCVSYTSKRYDFEKCKFTYCTGFVGHESNRITCETMYEWLRKLIGREANKKFSYSAMRTSFAIGVVQGLMEKYDTKQKSDSNETGLVIYDEVKNWIDNNMNMKTSKLRLPSVSSSAYAAGKSMGSDLSLNRQFGLKAIGA